MKKTVKKDAKKSQEYVNILGINVISTTRSLLLTNVDRCIAHSTKFYIVTPNPELVLASISNPKLKESLNSADFAVPDGTGLNYASKFLYGKPLNIIHGRKLFMNLVETASEKGWRLFFLGGENREAERAANELRVKYRKAQILTFAGPMLNQNAEAETEDNKKLEREAIERINDFRPELLFVAFRNPKQEIWIHKYLPKLKITGAMAVGGTFRYIAGMSPLPPKWMDKAGLEWLYRLITEPYRFKRIINAVILFPLRVFWYKLTGR